MNPKILIVSEDDKLSEFLKARNFDDIVTVRSYKAAMKRTAEEHFNVIIPDTAVTSDHDLSDLTGFAEHYRDLSPLVIVAIKPGSPGFFPEAVRTCMRAGAYDCISMSDGDAYQQVVISIREGLDHLKAEKVKIDRDTLYIQNHFSEFSERYPGEYVAVLDEAVVGRDRNYKRLKKSVEKRYLPHIRVSIVPLPDKELRVA